MQASSTADATSDIAGRLNEAIQSMRLGAGDERLHRLSDVQQKIDDLAAQGLLNRQQYTAATQTDFKRLYMRES